MFLGYNEFRMVRVGPAASSLTVATVLTSASECF